MGGQARLDRFAHVYSSFQKASEKSVDQMREPDYLTPATSSLPARAKYRESGMWAVDSFGAFWKGRNALDRMSRTWAY